ncbi:16394_t:CDS:2, partial [Dentiscutata heterogama]
MNQKIGDNCSANNSHVYTVCNSESVSELPIGNIKLLEERLKRYENEAGQIEAIIEIEDSMNVDLCFVLYCTGSMDDHIKAAKKHILKVASFVKSNNSNIEFWVCFCGYRDHSNNFSDRLQNFDFTNSLEKFQTYIATKVATICNNDGPEDVLGGLNAAITQMTWSNATRILIHIGDAPPHGHRFTNLYDEYPGGDPYGLTEKFPVFDLMTTGYNPAVLVNKFYKATSSAIFSSITLTTTLRNSKSIYSLQRKKLQVNPHEPDWTTLPEKTGKLLHCILPKTLAEVKDEYYFINSSFTEQDISFKSAPEPFSNGTIEKYLESVEIINIAYFLSTIFNAAAQQ